MTDMTDEQAKIIADKVALHTREFNSALRLARAAGIRVDIHMRSPPRMINERPDEDRYEIETRVLRDITQ